MTRFALASIIVYATAIYAKADERLVCIVEATRDRDACLRQIDQEEADRGCIDQYLDELDRCRKLIIKTKRPTGSGGTHRRETSAAMR